jgi:hypothetical protein
LGRLRSSIILKYRRGIDKARDALGDDIIIYYKTGNKISSPQDIWDPVNKEILNTNSTYANGNYYLDEIKTKTIKANTSWFGVSDYFRPVRLPAGILDVNDVYITCKLSDVLIDPSDDTSDTYFHRATKIIINGTAVIPKTTPLKYGLAGEFFSCALIATLDATQTA